MEMTTIVIGFGAYDAASKAALPTLGFALPLRRRPRIVAPNPAPTLDTTLPRTS